MKKIIVDRQYQLPEFPSVPYTPYNFWKTMREIKGIEVIVGDEPAKPTKLQDYRENSYRGIFHVHSMGITIDYDYQSYDMGEATVTLYGLAEHLRTTEALIKGTHREMKRERFG